MEAVIIIMVICLLFQGVRLGRRWLWTVHDSGARRHWQRVRRELGNR